MNIDADHMMMKNVGGDTLDLTGQPVLSRGQEPGRPGRVRFPWKLHKVLEDAEKENNDDIIGWLPDGRSFRVHKPKEFAEKIMPRYFNHRNFRSFQRQLYHYNFIRAAGGESRGAYSHPHFSKSDKSQCPEFHNREKVQVKNKVEKKSNIKSPSKKHHGLTSLPLPSTTAFDCIIRDIMSSETDVGIPSDEVVTCALKPSIYRSAESFLDHSQSLMLQSIPNESLLADCASVVDVEPIPLQETNVSSIEAVIDNVESLLAESSVILRTHDAASPSFLDPFMSPLDLDLEPTPLAEFPPLAERIMSSSVQ